MVFLSLVCIVVDDEDGHFLVDKLTRDLHKPSLVRALKCRSA